MIYFYNVFFFSLLKIDFVGAPFTFTVWKSATHPSLFVTPWESEWSAFKSDTFLFSPSEVHLEEVSAVGSAQLSYASFDPETPDASEDSEPPTSQRSQVITLATVW